MVTALSTLTRLETLHLDIASNPGWENRPLPQPTYTVLPSLTSLRFIGSNEYSENFLSRIDAPLLDKLNSAFNCFDPDMALDTPQLLRFTSRIPKFQAPDKAHIRIDVPYYDYFYKVSIKFSWPEQISNALELGIHCLSGEYVPCLVQFCHPPFLPLPTLKYLYIGGQFSPQLHLDDIGNTRWLELLRPFTAVENLYLTKEFAPEVAHALQNLAGEIAMVLPILVNVFIEPESQPSGSVQEAIRQFAAARQLSGHPIVIYHWEGRQVIEQDSDGR